MEQGLLHDVPDPRLVGVSMARPTPDHQGPETEIVLGGLLATTQVHPEIHRPDGRVAEPAPLASQHRPLPVALHDQNHRLHHHLPHHGRRVVVCRRQPDFPV